MTENYHPKFRGTYQFDLFCTSTALLRPLYFDILSNLDFLLVEKYMSKYKKMSNWSKFRVQKWVPSIKNGVLKLVRAFRSNSAFGSNYLSFLVYKYIHCLVNFLVILVLEIFLRVNLYRHYSGTSANWIWFAISRDLKNWRWKSRKGETHFFRFFKNSKKLPKIW